MSGQEPGVQKFQEFRSSESANLARTIELGWDYYVRQAGHSPRASYFAPLSDSFLLNP